MCIVLLSTMWWRHLNEILSDSPEKAEWESGSVTFYWQTIVNLSVQHFCPLFYLQYATICNMLVSELLLPDMLSSQKNDEASQYSLIVRDVPVTPHDLDASYCCRELSLPLAYLCCTPLFSFSASSSLHMWWFLPLQYLLLSNEV